MEIICMFECGRQTSRLCLKQHFQMAVVKCFFFFSSLSAQKLILLPLVYKPESTALPFSSCCIDPVGYNTRRTVFNAFFFTFSLSPLPLWPSNEIMVGKSCSYVCLEIFFCEVEMKVKQLLPVSAVRRRRGGFPTSGWSSRQFQRVFFCLFF